MYLNFKQCNDFPKNIAFDSEFILYSSPEATHQYYEEIRVE